MAAPRIGTRVLEGTRAGVVVDHRPQGMVDVCFEDSGFVERRPANLLLAMNPAAKRARLPAVRGKAAPSPETDLYDPTKEQFRAVVQGVYETLVTKELGAKAFKDARGARVDAKALKAGKVTQADLRALLSRAYAIATRQGQKYGYLEAGTQRPTKKGAALAAARYGADPKLVSRMLKGDAKAQKLAAAKDAAKREENRQDYEVTLQLVRKGQTQRVVEEVVGGKLVSFQQPGAKRVARRRNVVSWEERGMARGMASFSAKMRPFLEEARHLGRQKGQALRQFAQVRKPSAKDGLLRTIAEMDAAFRAMTAEAVNTLGMDALDERGLIRPEVRQDIGGLLRAYEDTAADVQAGRPVKNPVNPRTKGIGIKGVGYHWGGIRTGKKSEFTPVTLSATPPALDVPDGKGFFLISFDPNRKDVERVLREVGGWRLVPQITGTKYETGLVKDAPKVHTVVQYTKGGSGARGKGGQFAKGYYAVQGPKAKPKDVFERKDDAVEYAKVLDQRLVSFLVPETHEIWQMSAGYEVRGPQAENEIERRVAKNKEREDRGEDPLWNEDLIFDDPESALRMAAILDLREAKGGALPIKGYRTAPGLSGEKAAKKYTETLAALDDNKVHYVLDRSLKQMEAPSTGTKRFTRVAVDPPGIRYVPQLTVAEVRSKPDTLFVFGDNMEREGKGGQAVIRDESNALGIPTKWRPSRDEDAYFTNADFPEVRGEIDAALNTVEKYLRAGRAVALPSDGVGTGLAELPKRAPKIHAYITKRLAALKDIKPAVAASRLESRVITLPDAPTSARQRRLAERTPERLVETLLARGEDPDQLIELVAEAEERGRKKLANRLAKSYADDAAVAAKMLATKKLGAQRVTEILGSEREKTKMRASLPGGFVQKERAFGEQRGLGFEKEASDLDVLLAALYPKGNVPPTMLPKYERAQLLDMDDDDLDKLAKKKLGLSDKEIEKIRTSVERTVLSRVAAERAPATGVELIERGGFEVEMTPKQRRALEEKRVGRAPGSKPVPRPIRPETVAEKSPATKVVARDFSKLSAADVAKLDLSKLSDAELKALKSALFPEKSRKANGLFSTGLRAARSGGKLAVEYGSKAYTATRAWLGTAAGQKFTAEVAGLAVSLFGAAAVSRGKLTPEQAEIVRREFERKTGQRVDSQTVRAAIQSQGV